MSLDLRYEGHLVILDPTPLDDGFASQSLVHARLIFMTIQMAVLRFYIRNDPSPIVFSIKPRELIRVILLRINVLAQRLI